MDQNQVCNVLFVCQAYLLLVVANAGCLHADTMGTYGQLDWYDRAESRRDRALAIGLSLIPVTWMVTMFFTGFYQHGWSLSLKKET